MFNGIIFNQGLITKFKKRLFNEFYLYKCAKNLPKLVNYKEFNFLNVLKKNYKNKLKINKKLGKDLITLYK